MAEYKAWLVREKGEFLATVVFAETRGKARALAQQTNACEGADFIDIEVIRIKKADKYYNPGKIELDWENAKDRIALVKDCGFTCDYDIRRWVECETCPAREFCGDFMENEE